MNKLKTTTDIYRLFSVNQQDSVLIIKLSVKIYNILLENYSKRKKSSRVVQVEELEFPKLTEAYIKSITYGVYQLKQCVPYTISHLEQNADYVCEFYGENEELVRVK
ncbi:hypothetical protein BpHYR1_021714 [Brachionus plicatilis]|uniref:Uncharacterized protein n=1 Tax=Brachionus plicatilis TaxID=10195 RepID=A0A3M7T5L8_BRAPC|nr:hypothetical protein BpHYR1_021714 [Brachionus plicatilis]